METTDQDPESESESEKDPFMVKTGEVGTWWPDPELDGKTGPNHRR